MTPLRLLHVVANPWWTGAAAPALDLAQSLAARGHVVRFACAAGAALEVKARSLGLPPVPGLVLRPRGSPLAMATDVLRLRRLIQGERVQVVHTHQTHDHWLCALAAAGTAVRLVRTVHHRRAVHRGIAARWLVGRTHAVIAVSPGIADSMRDAGLPGERLITLRGAVDAGRFDPSSEGQRARAGLGLGAGPVVGTVARLVPGRGHEVLLRAGRLLREAMPALRILLVGRGEGRPDLERLVRELDLDSAVVFAGYRGDDLPEVLAAMDCFVLLGTGSEESCRAALEAMAAGRPVVAARVGALPETVVDGETGWLVAPEPPTVADRIDQVLRAPERARAMGAAGRRRVLAEFNPEARAAAVERLYARLLAIRP